MKSAYANGTYLFGAMLRKEKKSPKSFNMI